MIRTHYTKTPYGPRAHHSVQVSPDVRLVASLISGGGGWSVYAETRRHRLYVDFMRESDALRYLARNDMDER